MIRRRYNSQVKFLPRTALAWIALVLVAASLVTFSLALQINSGVGPWPALITGSLGIALGILMGLWRKDVSILLGILGAISGSLLLFLVLTVFITASA